ncbi:MAG: hypothetical protein SNJ71_02690, partial [Bacteroidales bacterium]
MIYEEQILSKVGYNKYSLFFNSMFFENDYWEFFYNNTYKRAKKIAIIGLLTYILIALADFYNSQSFVICSWACFFTVIKLLLASIIFLTILRITRKQPKPFLYEIFVGLSVVLLNLSNLLWDTFYHPPSKAATYYGLILFFIFTFTLVNIRFYWAFISSVIMYICFTLIQIITGCSDQGASMVNILAFLGFTLSALAGYQNELVRRKEFLLIKELYFDKEKAYTLNEYLEHEVQEHRRKLLDTNQALIEALEQVESSTKHIWKATTRSGLNAIPASWTRVAPASTVA